MQVCESFRDLSTHTHSARVEVRGHLKESVLSFHHEGPRDQTQVTGLVAAPLPA